MCKTNVVIFGASKSFFYALSIEHWVGRTLIILSILRKKNGGHFWSNVMIFEKMCFLLIFSNKLCVVKRWPKTSLFCFSKFYKNSKLANLGDLKVCYPQHMNKLYTDVVHYFVLQKLSSSTTSLKHKMNGSFWQHSKTE